MADPLAVLVLLGAVAAAASLSVNEGGSASAVPASPGKSPADAPCPRTDGAPCPRADGVPCGADGPRRADDVVRAWLDSLAAPALKR